MKKTIGLKLDIDTYRGMKEGLPRLLDFFEKENIRASVFVSFGPDESGKAVKRVFTRKGFLKKMFRSNAAKLYGFKTMLYGTLLPAPQIGNSFPDLARRAENLGHEVGIHCYNHILWQDSLDELSEEEIALEISMAVDSYETILRKSPPAFAAPGWQINEKGLKGLLKYPWKYFSISRGSVACRFKLGETVSGILDIPTTMPTLDEILSWDGMNAEKALEELSAAPKETGLNVFTFHTEVEGMAYFDFFRKLLGRWKERGFVFATLGEIVSGLHSTPGEVREMKKTSLPGRAGPVASLQQS